MEREIAANIDSDFAFPIVIANHWPYQIIWNKTTKKAMLLQLTIVWKKNFQQAEEQKVKKMKAWLKSIKNIDEGLSSGIGLLAIVVLPKMF